MLMRCKHSSWYDDAIGDTFTVIMNDELVGYDPRVYTVQNGNISPFCLSKCDYDIITQPYIMDVTTSNTIMQFDDIMKLVKDRMSKSIYHIYILSYGGKVGDTLVFELYDKLSLECKMGEIHYCESHNIDLQVYIEEYEANFKIKG